MIFLVVLAYQPRRQGRAGKEWFAVAGDGNGSAEAHQWRCIDGPPAGGKGQYISVCVPKCPADVAEKILRKRLRCSAVDGQLPEVCGVHGSGFRVEG